MARHSLIALFLCTCLMLPCQDGLSWGQKGHDVTCAIAQEHLSRNARKRVSEIFEGKSMVYWANWMDQASHTREYDYTKTWHYRDVDAGEDFDTAPVNESGDVLTAIDAQIAALKSGGLNRTQEAVALRMLIHLVGDLHCPMHMAHRSDKGGNMFQLSFFGKGSNLHSVWDSGLLERAHGWTYSEWVTELDISDRKEISTITDGTPLDWGRETYRITEEIYRRTPAGADLSYGYVAEWTPTAERQLLYGGIRLAYLLNGIFR